jgi:O-glycosyl hydrolase
LPSTGSNVEVYRSSATEDLAHLPPIAVKDWSYTTTLPASSVTTFVVPLLP